MRLSFLNENWNRFFVLSPRIGFGTLTRADFTFRWGDTLESLVDKELKARQS